MLFRRFYDDPLAQASYLIGCQATGEAIVVDPNRDAGQYIAAAEAEGLEITGVTETHIHADFVSGARELSVRTGARMYLSDAGPPEWRYAFRDDPAVRLLRGGEEIRVGNVVLEPVHTPGHTPEHLSFFVTDGATATEAMGILTGDFVFVGDVGRPDLLEKAAHIRGTMEASARDLFRSLSWFKGLPDHLQVWPGHGAGSACGKGIGAVPQSTVGYERRNNWALAIADEAEFVRQVLLGQPEPPRYFAVMKQINRDGPRLLGGLPTPPRLSERRLPELLATGALVVDTRPTRAFAMGHVPGTINLPLGRSFTTYAGSLLPYDRECHLIVDAAPGMVDAAAWMLVSIGLDRIAGFFGLETIDTWIAAGGTPGTIPQVNPDALAEASGDAVVVDVRGEAEWQTGHIPGAVLIPLPELPARLDEIPAGRTPVTVCGTGSRSAVAASYLRSRGRSGAANLSGGMTGWLAAGLPVERPPAQG